MDELSKKYLEKSLDILSEWLPLNKGEMLLMYDKYPQEVNVEGNAEQLVYCLFSYPEIHDYLERIILFVYDHDQIIADCSGLHGKMKDVLNNQRIYDFVSAESDWLYLEHYALCGSFFSDIPYPAFRHPVIREPEGEAMLYSNAYVSKAYRQKGIFRTMLEMMRDHCIRQEVQWVDYFAAISLDPDIACYGPDAVGKPYVYSMNIDEPKRMRNRMIIEKCGYRSIRLEETESDHNSDGSKLWFALQHERDFII